MFRLHKDKTINRKKERYGPCFAMTELELDAEPQRRSE